MNEAPMGPIAITGAGGLVGSHLCDYFRRSGRQVRGLALPGEKFPFDDTGIEFFGCQLPDEIEDGALDGVDTLIHAAYMTQFVSIAEGKRVNEDGTARIFDEAGKHGVRKVVFISSLSAHPEALSYYGQSKYRLEQTIDQSRNLIIRPGLVLSTRGGLFSRMTGEIRRARVVPVFDGGRQIVQTIHIDDLCEAFGRAVERDIAGIASIAEPAGLSMMDFLRELAKRTGRRPLFVPVPSRPAVAILRHAERLGMRLPVGSENVLGLVAMRHVDTENDLARLDLQVKSTRETLDLLFSDG